MSIKALKEIFLFLRVGKDDKYDLMKKYECNDNLKNIDRNRTQNVLMYEKECEIHKENFRNFHFFWFHNSQSCFIFSDFSVSAHNHMLKIVSNDEYVR